LPTIPFRLGVFRSLTVQSIMHRPSESHPYIVRRWIKYRPGDVTGGSFETCSQSLPRWDELDSSTSGTPERGQSISHEAPLQRLTLLALPRDHVAQSRTQKQSARVTGSEATKKKYGYPAAYKAGSALWKRPSDGSLVSLVCPVKYCHKANFKTLHGFMYHIHWKHQDNIRDRSVALNAYGIVYGATVSQQSPCISRTERTESRQIQREYNAPNSCHHVEDVRHAEHVVKDTQKPEVNDTSPTEECADCKDANPRHSQSGSHARGTMKVAFVMN